MGAYKRLILRLFCTGMALACLSGTVVMAAQSVTQGYGSDQDLQLGMIVRLKPKDSNKVEALAYKDIESMLGVVVPVGDSPVTISTPGDVQQVFVSNNGQHNVLVSTQNGAVAEGDYVTISSIAGVGMKAGVDEALVVGKALKAFSGATDTDSTATIKTSKGTKPVSLGRIPVAVSISHNPAYTRTREAGVPQFLSKAAEVVTNEPVSAFRIYASLTIMLLTFILSGSLLYSGVRTSLTAIGRNPLARHSIFQSLLQVMLVSIIIFTIGIIAVYLLLKV
jgi:hypothetical protein